MHAECGPAGRIVPCHGGQREDVLRRDPHELGERTVVQVPGEPRAALAARAPALERDVGRQGVVPRAHRRVAPHQVTDAQPGGIRADVDDPPHAADTGHDRRDKGVVPLAAEDLGRVRRHAGGEDLDHHLTAPDLGVGHLPHHERGAELRQNCCSHVMTSVFVRARGIDIRSGVSMREAMIWHSWYAYAAWTSPALDCGSCGRSLSPAASPQQRPDSATRSRPSHARPPPSNAAWAPPCSNAARTGYSSPLPA